MDAPLKCYISVVLDRDSRPQANAPRMLNAHLPESEQHSVGI